MAGYNTKGFIVKSLIIGAGGIVGQEMRASVPNGVEAVFTRTEDFNITSESVITEYLDYLKPDAVLNLSGQNNVDIVEKDPDKYIFINQEAPGIISRWCDDNNAYMIQASTQGVFSGENPRYSYSDIPNPITEYGKQKRNAELAVSNLETSLIARLTFVYGIRPDATFGRANPLEQMMAEENQLQVDDRFFSPLWSRDAASILWDLLLGRPSGIVHLGQPIRVSRYDLACHCAWDTARVLHIKSVSHEFFKGIAQRPHDTTWDRGSLYKTSIEEAILTSYLEWSKK
jgi:dTDP-4-dehydrorhamnose reductase